MMRAHLKKTTIILPLLADEDRFNRRLHIVVDAARAGALEEGKRPIVGVKHHLLRLARTGAHKHHTAVAEADMGDLHGRRHSAHHHDLVAPIELVGLARCKNERHVGLRQHGAALLPPSDCVAPNRGVAPAVTEAAQLLE
jgi:hypothetical protein